MLLHVVENFYRKMLIEAGKSKTNFSACAHSLGSIRVSRVVFGVSPSTSASTRRATIVTQSASGETPENAREESLRQMRSRTGERHYQLSLNHVRLSSQSEGGSTINSQPFWHELSY